MGIIQTKKIDKLIELGNFYWNMRNRIIRNCGNSGASMVFQRCTKNIHGANTWIDMFNVSKNNLDELEFYGLKVILNEKPKLTKRERYFLECFEANDWIARCSSGRLYLFGSSPEKNRGIWESKDYGCIVLNNGSFPFITWKSGKAWSKDELMKLEVME